MHARAEAHAILPLIGDGLVDLDLLVLGVGVHIVEPLAVTTVGGVGEGDRHDEGLRLLDDVGGCLGLTDQVCGDRQAGQGGRAAVGGRARGRSLSIDGGRIVAQGRVGGVRAGVGRDLVNQGGQLVPVSGLGKVQPGNLVGLEGDAINAVAFSVGGAINLAHGSRGVLQVLVDDDRTGCVLVDRAVGRVLSEGGSTGRDDAGDSEGKSTRGGDHSPPEGRVLPAHWSSSHDFRTVCDGMDDSRANICEGSQENYDYQEI